MYYGYRLGHQISPGLAVPVGRSPGGGGSGLVQRFAGTGNRIGLATGTFQTLSTKDRTRIMGRTVHYFGRVKPVELRIMAFSWYLGTASEVEMSGTKTLEGAIELGDASETVAVTWGGSATGTLLSTDTYVLSDPLTVDDFTSLTEWTDRVYVRLAQKAAIGDQYASAGNAAYDTSEEEFAVGYTVAGEAGYNPVTDTGNMASAPNSEFIMLNTVGPGVALVGTFPADYPVVGLIGDSVMNGSADSAILSGFGKNGGGPGQRGLWDIDGAETKMDWVRLCANGHKAETAQGSAATKRKLLYPFISYALVNYGINDLAAGASDPDNIRGWLQTIATELRAAGAVPYHTTVIPRTFTTDSYQTLVNQTNAGYEAKRVTLNGYLATDVGATYWAGLVSDWVAACVDSGTPTKWKVDGTSNYATSDGLHPQPVIVLLMAEAVAAWAHTLILATYPKTPEVLGYGYASMVISGGSATVDCQENATKPEGATHLFMTASPSNATQPTALDWNSDNGALVTGSEDAASASASVNWWVLDVTAVAASTVDAISVTKAAGSNHGTIGWAWLKDPGPESGWQVVTADTNTTEQANAEAAFTPATDDGIILGCAAKRGVDAGGTWFGVGDMVVGAFGVTDVPGNSVLTRGCVGSKVNTSTASTTLGFGDDANDRGAVALIGMPRW